MTSNTWVLTHSGRKVDLINPDPASINIQDIAWHLSGINRYTGAASRNLTVLEHSIYVWQIVAKLGGTPAAQLWALLHDAHEAYMGDIATPMKRSLEADADGDYVYGIELGLDRAILKALAIAEPSIDGLDLIKKADHIAMAFERTALLPPHPEWTFDLSKAPAKINVPKIIPHVPPRSMAAAAFVNLFQQLQRNAEQAKAAA